MAATRPSTRHLSEALSAVFGTLGQATETDAASRLAKPIGRAIETEIAQPVVRFSLSAWTWSKAIRVSSLNYNTLTRQVAIDLSTIPAIFAAAKADGSDIRVTDATRATFLPYYLESYNAGAHTGTLWVKLTGLTIVGQTISIFAGNPAATSAASFDATFQKLTADDKTKLLWHLDEGSGKLVADASSNGLNGSVTGASWAGSDGGGWKGTTTTFASGDCLSFTGSTDVVTNASYSIGTSGGAFDAYITPTFSSTTAVSNRIIAYFGNSGSHIWLYYNFGSHKFILTDESGEYVTSSAQTFSANVPMHIGLSWYDDPTNIRHIYVNGVDVTLTNDLTRTFAGRVGGVTTAVAAGFSLGYGANSAGHVAFGGKMDEVRLSIRPRTPEEMQSAYLRRGPLPNPLLTESASDPIVVPALTWEGGFTTEATVIRESPTDWRMWYWGRQGSADANGKVGYATSTDGVSWTKYVSNPIFSETLGTAHPHVTKIAATYYLTYYRPDGTLRYATSSDGITWSAGTTMLTLTGVEAAFGNSYLWLESGTYNLLFDYQTSDLTWHEGLATSPDLVTWTRSPSNPVLDISGGTIGGVDLYKIGSKYYGPWCVALSGVQPTDIYAYKASSLTSWTEVNATNNPIIWRTKTAWVNQVADPQLVEANGTTYFYFTGVDGSNVERVNLATTPYTINQLLTAPEAPTYSSSGITVALGQALETDVPLALPRHQTVVLGQATETDNALGATPITNPIVTTRGQVSVSDASTYTVTLSDAGTYMLTIADTAV